MAQEKMLKAGVIGLGMIGGGIAVSLTRSGRIPAVYDIRKEAAENLEGILHCLDSPADVARYSDVVMVCVVNAEQVYSVLKGETGLLAGAHPGLVLCLVSTVSMQDVKEIEELCKSCCISFMDCGVTPGNLAASHGMTVMVGADSETLKYASPVLEDWAKRIIHCGSVGAGMAVKLARNTVTYGVWRITKEAEQLAEAAGVKPGQLLEVLKDSDPSGRLFLSHLEMAKDTGKIPEAAAEKILPLMKKDLAAACELANDLEIDFAAAKMANQYVYETMDMEPPFQKMEDRERGAMIADLVDGSGMGEHLKIGSDRNPYSKATLEYIFANVWPREGLSLYERRLLVMGAAAGAGRGELLKYHALGALENHEMSLRQLDEAELQLAVYTGWCNGGVAAKGIAEAKELWERSRQP